MTKKVLPKITFFPENYYATVIKSELVPAIQRKSPQLQRSDIWLRNDNAPSHGSHVVLGTIKELGIDSCPHTPYSLDLAIFDFWIWLFSNVTNG